jgi:DNA-directed RNA polymerase alpha subunit
VSAGRRKELVMIDPSPELPDDMPIASVEFPPKVRQALIAAGLRTIGKIRETPDTEILRIQDLGQGSLNFLRDTLGLPSSMGVRRDAIPMTAKSENRDH